MKWNAAALTTNTSKIYWRPVKGCLLLDEGLPIKSEKGCKLNKHHLVGSVLFRVLKEKAQKCSKYIGNTQCIYIRLNGVGGTQWTRVTLSGTGLHCFSVCLNV